MHVASLQKVNFAVIVTDPLRGRFAGLLGTATSSRGLPGTSPDASPPACFSAVITLQQHSSCPRFSSKLHTAITNRRFPPLLPENYSFLDDFFSVLLPIHFFYPSFFETKQNLSIVNMTATLLYIGTDEGTCLS